MTPQPDLSRWEPDWRWHTRYAFRNVVYSIRVWWHAVRGHRLDHGSFEDSDCWECLTCKKDLQL